MKYVERQWKCHTCQAIVKEQDFLTAPNPFKPWHKITGCPICLSINEWLAVCDEPGCKKTVACGWPSPNGYRTTCADHVQ